MTEAGCLLECVGDTDHGEFVGESGSHEAKSSGESEVRGEVARVHGKEMIL